MTGSSVSRWWYGVAITTLLCVLLYALGSLFVLLGPSQPAGSDGELVVKVLSLAATVVVALVLHVATAIYVGSFVLDWWYLSKSDATEWSPPGWYLLVPLVALGNFVVPVIATPILTVGGGCYLIKRSRMVGTPGLGV
jgi:hypothetical protein